MAAIINIENANENLAIAQIQERYRILRQESDNRYTQESNRIITKQNDINVLIEQVRPHSAELAESLTEKNILLGEELAILQLRNQHNLRRINRDEAIEIARVHRERINVTLQRARDLLTQSDF